MKRPIRAVMLILTLAFISLPTAASATEIAETVTVTINPPMKTIVLGENLDLVISITNEGADTTPPLIAHIDITNPDETTSVDPEDWTPTLSKAVDPIAPGETIVVDWNLQPISAGDYVTYAIVLSPGVDSISASNVLEIGVIDERGLNPGGILPVALLMPALIGVLLIAQMRHARRNRQTTRPMTHEAAT